MKLNNCYTEMVNKIGDIILTNIWEDIYTDIGTKKIVNLKLLIKYVIKDIFSISTESTVCVREDIASFMHFCDTLCIAIEKFFDFFGYNVDRSVEIITIDGEKDIIMDENIEILYDDYDGAISSFNVQGKLSIMVMAIVSNFVFYYTNNNIICKRKKYAELIYA